MANTAATIVQFPPNQSDEPQKSAPRSLWARATGMAQKLKNSVEEIKQGLPKAVEQLTKDTVAVTRAIVGRANAMANNLQNLTIQDIKKGLPKAAAQLNKAVQATPGFIVERVKHVWNMSREDKAWAIGTMGTGALIKFGLIAGAGVASGGTVYAALLGGAVVGLTKSAVAHYREGRKLNATSPVEIITNAKGEPEIRYVREHAFFSKKTLMNTVSGAALSALSFGMLSGAEHVTGFNFSNLLSKSFNKESIIGAVNKSLDHMIGAQANTLPSPSVKQFVPFGAYAAQVPVVEHVATPDATAHKVVAAAAKTARHAFAANTSVADAATAPAPAAHIGGNANVMEDERKRAFDAIRKLYPANDAAPAASPAAAPVTVAAAPVATVTPTPAPVAVAAPAASVPAVTANGTTVGQAMPNIPHNPTSANVDIKTATGKVTTFHIDKPNAAAELANIQSQQRTQYIEDRLRDMIARSNMPAPKAGTSFEQMAKMIMPSNPEGYLGALKQQALASAPQVDGSKMAAACVAELPKTAEQLADQGHYVPNGCTVLKAEMADGDYVSLRDQATPGKKGLRVLAREAFDGLKEKTTNFIKTAVTDEAIPDMAKQSIADEGRRVAAEAASRNILLAAQTAALIDSAPTP